MNHKYKNLTAIFVASLCFITTAFSSTCSGQQFRRVAPQEMTNGDFEEFVDGKPVDWSYNEAFAKGVKFQVDKANPFSGETCMLIDTSGSEEMFTTFNHPVKPDTFAGKRIRFQAALRVEEGEAGSNVGLWLRADRVKDSGRNKVVAFENMQGRPVTDSEWQHYSIVIDVPDDADALFVGLIVGGKVQAWIDDASLEVVDDDIELTAEAGTDGPDSFLTWWLMLPGIAIALFGLSHYGASFVQRFALRFSVAYWLLYFLPEPFSSLSPSYDLSTKYHEFVSDVVNWFGIAALNIDAEWAVNGSGDTSYDFAKLLSVFMISLFVALVWSFLDWRKTDSTWLKDLLRSLLRYSLAFAMASYGLAKLTTEMNQFPIPGPEGLEQTFGESSPMGLLWTFMGASRAYTNFAGLGELVAALLLVWRRTTILGALVAIGVMTNVVMLNFCYDVPVKLYSTHLLVAATFILLPEFKRLANVLLLNRISEPAKLRPPYTGPTSIWFQRAIKVGLIVMGVGLPFYSVVKLEMKTKVAEPVYYGSYLVEEFSIGAEPSRELAGSDERLDDTASGDEVVVDPSWRYVTFRRYPFSQNEGEDFTDTLMIRAGDLSMLGGPIKPGDDEFGIVVTRPSDSLPERLSINVIDEEHLEVSGETVDGKPLVAKLKRNEKESLLMTRGFRWINETPYNR